MRRWRTIVAGAALLGVVLVRPAGAQAAPTLTASPSQADPGDVVTVTVEGCATPPRLGYQVVDGSGETFEVDSTEAGVGVATAEVEAPVGDLYLYIAFGQCGVGTTIEESPTAWVDVEAPLLYAIPSPELPLTVYGTDCPPGATPEVTVSFADQSYDIDDLEVDERGDWSFYVLDEVPVTPDGPGTVEATCGDVVYETLALDVPGGPPPTSTTTTTPTGSSGPDEPSAPAATPVPGAARFTG